MQLMRHNTAKQKVQVQSMRSVLQLMSLSVLIQSFGFQGHCRDKFCTWPFPVNLWKLAALHLLFGYNLPLYIKNC